MTAKNNKKHPRSEAAADDQRKAGQSVGVGAGVGAAGTQIGSMNTPPDTFQPANDVEDDVVTEQSMESFPASDPPSWTPEKI